MPLIKHKGYKINYSKPKKLLLTKRAKNFLKAIAELHKAKKEFFAFQNFENPNAMARFALKLIAAAEDLLELTEIESVVIYIEKYDLPEMQDFDFICSYAEQNFIDECACLKSVIGKPPYDEALKFGLTEEDISEYQNQWREFGIEPTLVELVKIDDY